MSGCGGVEKEVTATKWLIFLNVLPITAKILVLNVYVTVQCTHVASLKLTAQSQETVYTNYELTIHYFNS